MTSSRSPINVAPASRALLATVAMAAVVAGCHEVVAPKDGAGLAPAGVTPEGVVVAARISDTYFGPGDTVRATVVLRNPGDSDVILKAALLQFEGAASPELGVCARWVSPRGRFVATDGYCTGYESDVAADLLIPARDSLTYGFTLVGDEAMAEGKYTFWGDIALRPESSPTDTLLLVHSNPVSATLGR